MRSTAGVERVKLDRGSLSLLDVVGAVGKL